jgi:hypothetical protein
VLVVSTRITHAMQNRQEEYIYLRYLLSKVES